MNRESEQSGNAMDDPGESESGLRLILDKTPALINSTRPDGFIDFFNQRFLEFLGLPFEEVSGWGWTQADQKSAEAALWKTNPILFVAALTFLNHSLGTQVAQPKRRLVEAAIKKTALQRLRRSVQ